MIRTSRGLSNGFRGSLRQVHGTSTEGFVSCTRKINWTGPNKTKRRKKVKSARKQRKAHLCMIMKRT